MAYEVVAGKIIELAADSKKFNKAIREIDQETRTAQKTVNELKNNLENGWDNTKFKKAQELSQKAIEATTTKVELLKSRLNEIQKQEKTEKNVKEFNKLTKEIAYTENQLEKAKKRFQEINNLKLDKIANEIDKVGNGLENAGEKISIASTALATSMVVATKAAIDYEDAFAGVEKTVDASEEELSQMKEQLIEMSKEMPMTANELAGIAESAGQLGIKKENIISFTKTIADLGVATNMTGEEAASTLAKYANITKMDQADFDKLGSTIVELGNNSATTEKDIAEMALRLAAAGKQAGMTDAEILSFSASLSSVGIEAEAGGSAFSKLFSRIQLAVETGNEDLNNFAEVSNMSISEFKTAFEEDAAGAIITFITGLSNAEERGMSAIEVLDKMEISETRMRDSILRAAGASELFTNTISLGNNAWNENLALTTEANKKYETTASQMEIAKNNINAIAIELGEILLPMVIKITDGIADVTKWFDKLDDASKNNIVRIASFVVALGPMLTITGKLTKGVASAIVSINSFKKANEAATLSQAAMNAVAKANPYVLLASVIATVTAVLISFNFATSTTEEKVESLAKKINELSESYDRAKESAEDSETAKLAELNVVKSLIPELEKLSQKTDKTTEEKNRLSYIVEQLNEVMPNLKLAIDNETGALNTQIGVIYNAVTAYEALARAKAAEEVLTESSKLKLTTEKEISENQMKLEGKKLELEHFDNSKYTGTAEYNKNRLRYEIETLKNNISNLEKLKSDADKDIEYYTDYIKQQNEEYQKNLATNKETTVVSTNDIDTNNINTLNLKTSNSTSSKVTVSDEYKSKLKLLKYEKELEIKTEDEYYKELQKLSDKYLEEYSDEWISVQTEIFKYNKKQKENEIKLAEEKQEELLKKFEEQKQQEIKILEDSEEEKIKIIEENYNKKVQLINKEIEAEEKRINTLIEGLEKEEELKNREAELNDIDKKISYIETEIKYSRDINSTAELEKELIRLKAEKEDLTKQYALEDKKEALEKELEAKKEKANKNIEDLSKRMEVDIEKVKSSTIIAINEINAKTLENQTTQINNTFSLVKEKAEEVGGTLAQNTSDAIMNSLDTAAQKALELISQIKSAATNNMVSVSQASKRTGEHGTWGDWEESNSSGSDIEKNNVSSPINVVTKITASTVTSGVVATAAKKVVNAILGKY